MGRYPQLDRANTLIGIPLGLTGAECVLPSNAVFLRGVGGDAATEPPKTGCSGYPEEEFSGTHKHTDHGHPQLESRLETLTRVRQPGHAMDWIHPLTTAITETIIQCASYISHGWEQFTHATRRWN